jgi:hypothetical protein
VDLNGQSIASPLANTGGTLANAAAFSGTQTVSGASIFSAAVGGTLNVASGGVVQGTGVTFTGPATFLSGGTQAPGPSAGSQTFANGLSFGAGSGLVWDLLDNTAAPAARGTAFDAVNVTGGSLLVSSSATMNLVFNAAGSTVNWSDPFWSSDHVWTVVDFTSSSPATSTGLFSLGPLGLDSVGQSLQSVSGRGSATFSMSRIGDSIVLAYSAVPEPSTAAIVAGAAMAAIIRFSRRRTQACEE